MKMKLNRILSALLLSVMLFSSVTVLAPIVSNAAGSQTSVDVSGKTNVDYNALVDQALKGDKLVMDAFLADLKGNQEYDGEGNLVKGVSYLDSYTSGNYAIFVNRYTGVLYYVNGITGQILTSNPTNHGGSNSTKYDVMSQILLNMYENAQTTKTHPMNSVQDSASLGQITVSAIKNGLRVNYAIGETSNRYLLPNKLTTERFNELFLKEFVKHARNLWTEEKNNAAQMGIDKSTTADGVYFFFSSNEGFVNEDGTYKFSSVRKYLTSAANMLTNQSDAQMLRNMADLVSQYNQVEDGKYYAFDPNKAGANKLLRQYAMYVSQFCPDYDLEEMLKDEKEAGYVQAIEHIPVLRCALEYTLNADGSLNVALPANSIIYDESFYTLEYIRVLPYFGSGDIRNDGYLFYPDGSGMILDFASLDGTAFNITNNVYGFDSGYSSVDVNVSTGGEGITMPVYGIVNDVQMSSSSNETVTNGFFAILEQGASMATLTYQVTTGLDFLYVYTTYKPYPADEYNLSSTISVSGLGKYIIVSDSRYTGVYNTRYVMLTDPDRAAEATLAGQTCYDASYVGMANYYRDYLKGNGTLTALKNLEDDIPLYVESFGSMDVLGRFLTFPVTESIPLTTFEDVSEMYSSLKDAGVKNVHFRLTGFANGGMNATYPVKSRWEKACGGARGFKKLLDDAKTQSAVKGQNFAVYPEFDFMYLSNSASFDGMSIKGNVACMVDNRYASKKMFGSVLGNYKNVVSLVITPDALPNLYEKFVKQYGDYSIQNLSVSTMGTDLNSNFDKKNSINREQSMAYVTAMLDTMSQKYQLMIDGGNVYALKYASHILNIATDSSHYRNSSYPVPFIGMILHGYISYAGAPLNYAGNARYDALRFIESGAAPYYILSYNEDNIKKLKENENLSKYYGVSYKTWLESVIKDYQYINGAIGELQSYEIVDHRVLIAERVWAKDEIENNLKAQKTLFLQSAKESINAQIAAKLGEMAADEKLGVGLKVTIDRNLLLSIFAEAAQKDVTDPVLVAFKDDELEAFCQLIEGNYNGTCADAEAHLAGTCGCTPEELEVKAFDVNFDFYVTESLATDAKNYKDTNYTVDNGNVVMVTYKKGDDIVRFILNYNSYAVTVRMDAESDLIEIAGYDYYPMDAKEG